MERHHAPLAEALNRHLLRSRASFHIPGHKAGAAFSPEREGIERALCSLGPFDVTELPGLDDLHSPQGVIAEAQKLAADCFGAERTYFLVGGSTAGNLAAIFAAVRPGELIVMQRNSHKSALHALMLREAGAVFISPETDERTGLPGPVSAEKIASALDKHPEAKAVFITSPNYYGITADIRAIAAEAHARGKPLIVDEAHGAHFGKHPRFPESALALGADAVIQSTHKMLSALTMGSMLHLRGSRLAAHAVEAYLRMLQTSSPSYPIMASLDLARRELDRYGPQLFEAALAAVDRWREALGRTAQGRFVSPATDDPFKLLLADRSGALNGFAMKELLEERGVFAEMANAAYAVLAASSATTWDELAAVLDALEEISRVIPEKKQENGRNLSNNNVIGTTGWKTALQPVYFSLEDAVPALGGNAAVVPLEQAAGKICAETIIPYPPGIPILFPGERITEEIVQALAELRECGAAVQGAADHRLRTITVRRTTPEI